MSGLDFKNLNRWSYNANYGGDAFGAQYLTAPQRTDSGNIVRWHNGKYDVFSLLDNNEQARINLAQTGNIHAEDAQPWHLEALRREPVMEKLREYLRQHNLWSD